MSHHNHCEDEHDCCHGEVGGHQHDSSSHGCCHHHHHEGEFAHELLDMADEAWMDLLREKIKAKIEASSGAQLDQLAALVSDANHTRWKHKLEKGNNFHEFKEKIDDFFNHKS